MPRPNPFLLVTALFWGFNFISLKVIYPVMEPGAVLFWRYFLMGGILVLICKATGQSLKIPAEHRNKILLAGFCSMGIYMILFMEGVKRTYSGEASIILATNPIMVAIWMMALRLEKRSLSKILGGLVALMGVAIVVLGRPGIMADPKATGLRLMGDGLMLAAAAFWSWSVVIAKPISSVIKPLPLFTMSMLGGLPVVLLYGFKPAMAVQWSAMTPWQWVNLAQVSLGSGVVAMVFYYKGISQLPASAATMYQFMVPIVTTFFAWLLLHEHLVWAQAVGLGIVLLGVSIANGIIQFRRSAELVG